MRGTIAKTAIAVVLLSGTAAGWADAVLDEPLALGNEQPLALIVNLPALRGGTLLAAGQTEWRADATVANNFVRDRRGAEELTLDGELQRYRLGVRHGIDERWELEATLSWLSYNGGVADHFIERWHKFWGLPDGGRPGYAADALHFHYLRNGAARLDIDSAQSGIGDLQLSAAYRLLQTTQTDIALATTLTLPTGSAARLTGNDAGNVGVALAATRRGLFGLPLTGTANVGAVYLPEGDVLAAQQKRGAWFAAGEIGWAVTRDLRLKLQLAAHSKLYDSALTTLGSDALQLLLGGSVRLNQRWVLDAAIGEDVRVDTAPDVTFHLALRSRY